MCILCTHKPLMHRPLLLRQSQQLQLPLQLEKHLATDRPQTQPNTALATSLLVAASLLPVVSHPGVKSATGRQLLGWSTKHEQQRLLKQAKLGTSTQRTNTKATQSTRHAAGCCGQTSVLHSIPSPAPPAIHNRHSMC
jgi:hypothetical protein